MDAGRVRAQLDRILASESFTQAERSGRFLRFVVERTLEGRAADIKEYVIAVEVLGRDASFDPRSDPIVRVEAGRLRTRLNSYYTGKGGNDSVLIGLPKGSYVPEFSERQAPVRASRLKHPLVLLAAGVLFGFAVAIAGMSHLHHPNPGAVARLSILPPENTSFESFAISPDGRKLVFTATVGDKLMLWVRDLESAEAKPLPGTENAAYPFWSPDSRSIGFVATPAAKLKTIDIAGGPARDMADVVVGCGGAWSSEGVIVFCPRPVGVLYQVPANGGTPKPATSLDLSRAEVTHTYPQFLPDGRHFLYLAASSRSGESCIRVGSLDSTTSKVLLSADTSAAYAPTLSGHPPSLLFVYHGALMAQPFDSQRLEVSGQRTVAVPGIRYRPWQQSKFSISDNGVLVYQTGSAENRQLAWFDRRGKLLAKVGEPNDYFAFSLSPDEKHIAIDRGDDPATVYPTIWLMDLSHGDAAYRFTEADIAGASFAPVWSPDGSEILFSQGDDRAMRLLRQPVNGRIAQPVLDTPGPKFPNDWSSDGRFVTFGSQWPDYRYLHTWTLLLSGPAGKEKPRPFLQHDYVESSAYFFPGNGRAVPRWIAYTSDETGRDEVYVRDFPAGTRKWQVSSQGGMLPHWRRDGRELFYLTPDGMLMAVPAEATGTFRFGAPKPLFATGLHLTVFQVIMNQYAVSNGGQRFLFNRQIPETASGAITAVIPR
jgi:eukaryotic-like serine/threonine-protein kinase